MNLYQYWGVTDIYSNKESLWHVPGFRLWDLDWWFFLYIYVFQIRCIIPTDCEQNFTNICKKVPVVFVWITDELLSENWWSRTFRGIIFVTALVHLYWKLRKFLEDFDASWLLNYCFYGEKRILSNYKTLGWNSTPTSKNILPIVLLYAFWKYTFY